MDQETAVRYVGSLLYKWLYRPSLDVTSHDYVSKLNEAYGPNDYVVLVGSLEWAVLHPEYPFSSLFEGVTTPNAEIHAYFVQLLNVVKAVDGEAK